MTLLDVRGLEKRYPTFTLDKVSFSLEPGYIMGFIGRNGAGKTTTMKAMLTPQELASRAFDAGLNAGEHGVGLGHTR